MTGAQRRVRLFCLPYAGGSARSYLPWSRPLADVAEVVPLELPGRGERIRELPCDRLPALLDDLLPRVVSRADGPFALFGHSLGAAIGYELCHRLRERHGLQPLRLYVSAHRAPHLPLRERRITHLSDDEFTNHLRELGGTPAEVFDSPELMRLLLPVLRADFALSESFGHPVGDPLDCPITAFGGTHDPDVNVAELSAWQQHTNDRCPVRMFDGDHFFITAAQAALIEAVREELHTPAADLAPRSTVTALHGGMNR
ncbi:thioesterase II family protein [Streptantibioticus ferralitis]|uniref:Alpha/beta fold hydrolase n=1 Tax=Streptantibioticus ferralitis TaxID=236510 RepID=A0ABT5Z1Q1_9ACTN|nr:alpha/beta fold hydrolase [Streptantibioticus ferralitis]MDF2257755.1 alpha/beta fold hydrolase [Streptantibioticus ferralitis]